MDFLLSNSGVILALLLLIFVIYAGRYLHKYQHIFELGALLLSIIVYLSQPQVFDFNLGFIESVISSGHLSLAFFLLVMFTGVLKKNSKVKKALSLVRAELAIIGFIFLLPHGLSRLDLALNGFNMSGLFAFILLIPLILTSFMFIRKKMNPKHWKQLHKLAYVAYVFIYIHLAFNIYIHPDFGYFIVDAEALLYHFILLSFMILRVVFVSIPKYQKKKRELNSNAV